MSPRCTAAARSPGCSRRAAANASAASSSRPVCLIQDTEQMRPLAVSRREPPGVHIRGLGGVEKLVGVIDAGQRSVGVRELPRRRRPSRRPRASCAAARRESARRPPARDRRAEACGTGEQCSAARSAIRGAHATSTTSAITGEPSDVNMMSYSGRAPACRARDASSDPRSSPRNSSTSPGPSARGPSARPGPVEPEHHARIAGRAVAAVGLHALHRARPRRDQLDARLQRVAAGISGQRRARRASGRAG